MLKFVQTIVDVPAENVKLALFKNPKGAELLRVTVDEPKLTALVLLLLELKVCAVTL